MRYLLAALFAALLAAPAVSADRPVGPETGQLGGTPEGFDDEPDELGNYDAAQRIINAIRRMTGTPAPQPTCHVYYRHGNRICM